MRNSREFDRSATRLGIEATNQETIWGSEYFNARKNCDHAHHLSDGPNSGIFGPLPGDPPDVAQMLRGLLVDAGPNQSVRMLQAAELIRNFSVEISDALKSHAQHVR